jgi:hypothetical protein
MQRRRGENLGAALGVVEAVWELLGEVCVSTLDQPGRDMAQALPGQNGGAGGVRDALGLVEVARIHVGAGDRRKHREGVEVEPIMELVVKQFRPVRVT